MSRYNKPLLSQLGMLKKAASGVLALLPCSRTMSTLRSSKWLRPCWRNFFEHSLPLTMRGSSGACIGCWSEIFNRPSQHFFVDGKEYCRAKTRLYRLRYNGNPKRYNGNYRTAQEIIGEIRERGLNLYGNGKADGFFFSRIHRDEFGNIGHVQHILHV